MELPWPRGARRSAEKQGASFGAGLGAKVSPSPSAASSIAASAGGRCAEQELGDPRESRWKKFCFSSGCRKSIFSSGRLPSSRYHGVLLRFSPCQHDRSIGFLKGCTASNTALAYWLIRRFDLYFPEVHLKVVTPVTDKSRMLSAMPRNPGSLLPIYRTAIRDAVYRHHTANPRVFGSVLEGRDTEASDLDLLVDALPGTTLFDIGALRFELEEMLGVSVDILTPEDLSSEFRSEVLAKARPL